MLLDAWVVDRKDLHNQFIIYDTAYFDQTSEKGVSYYELPTGKLIILYFTVRNGKNIMDGFKFTTLRRYTPKKLAYYKKQVGTVFDILRSDIND
ncbi:hypothetical protein AYK24_08410 [Thermoplasmatales archaeon SG8-52-4]|nr:MAG: hypothetical protein AYK24_08410 [Thermoplasmatales archaeon SG8-52-4]